VLVDLTAQHTQAQAQVHRVADEIATTVGRDLVDAEVRAAEGRWVTDGVALIPGEPARVVVLDVHGDIAMQARSARDADEPLAHTIRTEDFRTERVAGPGR